jgi:DNA-binding transcriptional LysR family regulator
MVLTAAGQRVLDGAGASCRISPGVEEDVRRIAEQRDAVIRCTQCNTGYHWLPPLLLAFGRKTCASPSTSCRMRRIRSTKLWSTAG